MKKSLRLIIAGLALMYSCGQPRQQMPYVPETITVYTPTDTIVYKQVIDETIPQQKESFFKRFNNYVQKRDSARAADIYNAIEKIDETVSTDK